MLKHGNHLEVCYAMIRIKDGYGGVMENQRWLDDVTVMVV